MWRPTLGYDIKFNLLINLFKKKLDYLLKDLDLLFLRVLLHGSKPNEGLASSNGLVLVPIPTKGGSTWA
jgi:hypothetical protein